jgi:hypothetical protein
VAELWGRAAPDRSQVRFVAARAQGRAIVQRTKIPENLGEILKNLGVSTLKKIISVAEPAAETVRA